jgi:hypothetical protein
MQRVPAFRTVLAVVAAACAAPALGHHSFAMFDLTKEVTLTGTIKSFEYTNPHTWTRLSVPNAQGGTDEWAFEGFGPGSLKRWGWVKDTLKPGDKVTVVAHPMRDGSKGGTLGKVMCGDKTFYMISLLPADPSYKPTNPAEQKASVAKGPRCSG